LDSLVFDSLGFDSLGFDSRVDLGAATVDIFVV
jgi:hypothetical protein